MGGEQRPTGDEQRGEELGNVTASGAATTVVSAMSERPASGTATVAIPSALSISNKPMVPTAHNGPDGNSLGPLRRHIGQSLGRKLPRTDAGADRLLAPSFVSAMREGHVSIVTDVLARTLTETLAR